MHQDREGFFDRQERRQKNHQEIAAKHSAGIGLSTYAGLGLRPHHYPDWRRIGPRTLWLEALADNYLFHRGGPALYHLDALAAQGFMLLHSVGLNIGGSFPLDDDYIAELARLIRRIKPAVVSDHLCFVAVPGASAFDLLPIPYTTVNLRKIVERVARVQDTLGVRLSLENVSSYISASASDYSELEFMAELCERSGAGVLLDVNNAYVSAANHGSDAWLDMSVLKPEHVTQYHIAGHRIEPEPPGGKEGATFLLDTHDQTIIRPVWQLLRRALTHFGPRPWILERDDDLELSPLLAELNAGLSLLDEHSFAQKPATI